MLVITTPTGHIGRALVDLLLAANEPLRVIARDPQRLSAEVRTRAEVIQGSSDDEAILDRALDGASGLFHCVPPDFAAPNMDEQYLRFTRPVIAAMKKRGVLRVVTVSALGRGTGLKAALVSSAFLKDVMLEEAGLHVRALWCPGFMENTLMSLETLRSQGVFFGSSRADIARPYAATKDIAATAARLLRDRSWTGPGGVAVLGPEDLSLDGMAAIMTDVLGRAIRYQPVPAAAYEAQLVSHGASAAFARAFMEMVDAKDQGLDQSVARTPENTTPTSFRAWCTEVLRPAF